MATSKNIDADKTQLRTLENQKKVAERSKATAEYMSEAKATALKTARLRELRLARDEAERAAEALKPAAPARKRATKAAASS